MQDLFIYLIKAEKRILCSSSTLHPQSFIYAYPFHRTNHQLVLLTDIVRIVLNLWKCNICLEIYNMEEFKCPSCKKQYSQTNPPRLLTMCGHTFCHQCLKTMIKRQDQRFGVCCPEDKILMILDLATPSYFPKNMAILEAILKIRKSKHQIGQDQNEFLISNSPKEDDETSDHRLSLDIRQQFINARRASLEQGLCLLHQKPLDIICTEQKKYICAQCALFGLHKGHHFTTIKELNVKRGEWLQGVLGLIEQQKTLQSKFKSGQCKAQICILLQNKKRCLLAESSTFYAQARSILQQNQKRLRQQINQKLQLMEKQLTQDITISYDFDKKFSQWSKRVEQKITSLQSDDIIQSLSLFFEDKTDLVSTGALILADINRDIFKFWSNIQNAIQFPKIQYSSQANSILQKLVTLHLSNPIVSKGQLQEKDPPSFPLKNDFSLLDNRQFKDDISSQNTIKQIEIETQKTNVELDCLSSRVSVLPEQSKLNLSNYRSLKRIKSGISFHKSTKDSAQAKIDIHSPKHTKKLQLSPRNNIFSPISGKSKIKKLIGKMKQPQKLQKILNMMEKDVLETADFTGLQMGDQIAKQFCLKITQCKKLKILRLIKNQLTDECAHEVALTLKKISILNLTQNGLGQIFLQALIDLAKKNGLKGKSVQLGQNRINLRKHKDKIDELKCLGIVITL